MRCLFVTREKVHFLNLGKGCGLSANSGNNMKFWLDTT